jgi:hypothetical protein
MLALLEAYVTINMQASILVQLYYQWRLQDLRTLLEACLTLLALVKRVVTVSFYIFFNYHSLRIFRLIGRC